MTRSRYRHVIFDFDGVICDSFDSAVCAYTRLRSCEFPRLPPIACHGDMNVVYQGSLRTCLHRWLTDEEARRFFDRHSAAMRAEAAVLKLFAGIPSLLISLGEARASIVTSAYSASVRSVLEADSELNHYRLHAIKGRELRMTKTEKIRAVVSSLQLHSDQVVYVGDLESDIIYCRDVPIDIIAVGYGYQTSSYLQTKGGTYFAESVEDLRGLLSELCGLH
jgi:phosphoglycolate phosphatase-like HAD superfamily hydrolase